MTEDEALAAFIQAGKDLAAGKQARSRYWRAKETLYKVRKASGKFPSDTCPTCLIHGVCCDAKHHGPLNAVCVHCGMDYR